MTYLLSRGHWSPGSASRSESRVTHVREHPHRWAGDNIRTAVGIAKGLKRAKEVKIEHAEESSA